jgi:hypothetical protein
MKNEKEKKIKLNWKTEENKIKLNWKTEEL